MSANTPDASAPYPGDPAPNRQAGRVLGEGDPAEAGVVASGDRREDVHFEADPHQLVVARFLVRPDAQLPPQEATPGAAAADRDAAPIEDVRVAPEGPSVWDARPPPDDADSAGG